MLLHADAFTRFFTNFSTRRIAALALATLLSGAFSSPLAAQETQRPSVALVLAGGGALGFAHIGVISVIEELGIPVDIVVGTSMGAIAGGLYAIGYNSEDLRQVATSIDWSELMLEPARHSDLSLRDRQRAAHYVGRLNFGREQGIYFSRGIVFGERVLRLFDYLVGDWANAKSFDDLPRRFRAVAADIESGEEVVLDSGSLATALRSSMSVPGIFAPVERDGRLLVDGGIVNNLPADVARHLGADIVIAVDLSTARLGAEQLQNPLGVISQTVNILLDRTKERTLPLADIVISPDVEGFSSTSLTASEALIERGRIAAERHRAELSELTADVRAGLGDENTENSGDDPNPSGEPPPASDPPRPSQPLTGLNEIARPLPASRAAVNELLPVDESLRLGFSFESHFGTINEEQFVTYFGAVSNNLTSPGSQATLSGEFGRSQSVEIDYLQPLARRTYVGASIYFLRLLRTIHEYSAPAEQYESRLAGASARLGFMLSRNAKAYVGYDISYVNSSARFDDAVIEEPFIGRSAGVFAGFIRDTLDRFPFPTEGSRATAEIRKVDVPLGSETSYERLTGEFRSYLPVARRHVILARLRAETAFDSRPPIWDSTWIGGREDVPGYDRFAYRARHTLSAGLGYRMKPPNLPGALSEQLFLSVRATLGVRSDANLSRISTAASDGLSSAAPLLERYWGAGVGAGLRTPIGALQSELALRDDLRPHLSFSLGNHF